MKQLVLGREKHVRSLVKAISWRTTGTIDTFLISYFVTGKVALASAIAGVEIITKICLYYFHERVWSAIPWGHRRATDLPAKDFDGASLVNARQAGRHISQWLKRSASITVNPGARGDGDDCRAIIAREQALAPERNPSQKTECSP